MDGQVAEGSRSQVIAATSGLTIVYMAIMIPAIVGAAVPKEVFTANFVLGACLIALSVIDFHTGRLPDVLTLPLIVAGVASAVLFDWGSLAWRLASAAAGFGSLYLVAKTYLAVRKREGLGLGDAKLLAASGAWLGCEALPSVVLYACGGALVAVIVGQLRGISLSSTSRIPFGPFLAFGTWLVWLYGPLA